MKNKTIPTINNSKKDNVILHKSGKDITLASMPHITTVRSSTYSKLDKAEKRELRKLKKELQDYTKE
jgi:hypothetical protein